MVKKLLGVVSVAMFLVAVGSGVRAVSGTAASRAADGLPNLTGEWDGKVKNKEHHMSTGEKPHNEALELHLVFTQTGEDIAVTFTATEKEKGDDGHAHSSRSEPVVYNLTGKVGNSAFWASGTTTGGETVTITGTIRGTRMKGIGIITGADEFAQTKFSLKQHNE